MLKPTSFSLSQTAIGAQVTALGKMGIHNFFFFFFSDFTIFLIFCFFSLYLDQKDSTQTPFGDKCARDKRINASNQILPAMPTLCTNLE